jgi:putative transcriptional regulator
MSENATTRYRRSTARPASFTPEEEAWLGARSEAEAESAAATDPDNPPATPRELARARRIVNVAELRRRLGLTQEQFARRYRLPVGTLRDWEQGRSLPDAPARALLWAIAREPELLERALGG